MCNVHIYAIFSVEYDFSAQTKCFVSVQSIGLNRKALLLLSMTLKHIVKRDSDRTNWISATDVSLDLSTLWSFI